MNQVRIIAGRWRRRNIQLADEPGIRPTMDRIRETLFNWLQSDIQGATCLDLFPGSGALGIEALSRGAKHVTFIDQSQNVTETISKQIYALDCSSFTTLCASLPNGLFKLANNAFDIIFLDPPYQAGLLTPCLETLAKQQLVKPGTLIYIEAAKNEQLLLAEDWELRRHKTTKTIQYGLIEVSQ